MIEFKCVRCGKNFYGYRRSGKDRKYCSRTCRDSHTTRFCLFCGKEFKTYPCRIKTSQVKYCSRECAGHNPNNGLHENSRKYQFKVGHVAFSKLHPELMPRGQNHKSWKGEEVGYRGLHYWLKRQLGIPQKCCVCGKKRTSPKSIQWANIDHKYRRIVSDYVPMCASCHKKYDLKLASSDDRDTTVRSLLMQYQNQMKAPIPF